MNNQINWPLLAKYLSGECSDEENAKVSELIEKDSETKKLVDSMKTIWELPEKDYDPSNVKALWNQVAEKTRIAENRIGQENKLYETGQDKNIFSLFLNQLRTPVYRYAAVFLLVAGVSVLYYLFSSIGGDVDLVEWKTVTVRKGSQSSITLNDGTKLYLDSGSHVQIPENFGIDSRTVKLEGEGYFEVTSNPQKPFIVKSYNAFVKVLGTKFNVRAWEEIGKVEVAVAEGRVSFGVNEISEKQIILIKGFSSTLSKTGELSEPKQVDISKYLSWINGEMSFDDVPVSEVLAQVERWYDIKFSLKDSTIINERLSVSINKNSLANVLEVLSTITATEYKIDGKFVYLIPRNSN